MLRKNLLKYAEEAHGDALAQVGLLPVDSPEAIGYCLNDAEQIIGTNEAQKSELDCRIAQLIHDRADMLRLNEPEATDNPLPVNTGE